MKKITFFLLMSLCCLTPVYSQGGKGGGGGGGGGKQTTDDKGDGKSSEEDGVSHFWELKTESGDFITALEKIVSISKSQYLLDGNLIVNEVTIDSGGRSLARFYHISTTADALADGKAAIASKAINRLQAAVDDAGDKANTDIHNMVQKTYPTTTHTGMIEYRIMDLRDLDAIYRSVQGSWQSGKPKKLTISK
jgi:hypothetical protein